MPDATERKVLIWCSFASAWLLVFPWEFRSAGALAVLMLLMLLAHRSITGREQALLELLEQWAPSAPASPLANAPEPSDVDGEVGKETP